MFFVEAVLWPVFIIREVKIGTAAAATALVRLFIEAVNTQKPLEEGEKKSSVLLQVPRFNKGWSNEIKLYRR